MKMFFSHGRRLASAFIVVTMLSACGGGGGSAGTPINGGGGSEGGGGGGGGGGGQVNPQLADLALVLNRTTVANTGSEVVTVTVTALDANRSALGDIPITFSINADGIITPVGTKTSTTNGVISATATIGANRTNRSITVTAASGSISRSVSFDVVSTTATQVVASDISMVLNKTTLLNSGSDFASITVTAVDAARNTVSGIPVSFSVNNDAVINVLNQESDSRGQSRAEVRIGDNRTERSITVTATSGTLTRTASILVDGVSISGTALPALPIAGSKGNRIEYRVTDINQNAMARVAITVSGAGLPTVTDSTDAFGAFSYFYDAPVTPGAVTVTASAAGERNQQTVTISSGTNTIPAAIGPVGPPTLSVSPNVVGTNSVGSSSNRAEIRALFLSPTNAPVRNVRVRFSEEGAVKYGAVASLDSLVYSDSSGLALSSFEPKDRGSPTDAVVILACWDLNDFAVGQCPNAARVRLTVTSDPLSITIGTDNTIQSGDTGLTYVKRYVLLVVDAAGNPKADVQLTPVVDLLAYRKGLLLYVGDQYRPFVQIDPFPSTLRADTLDTSCPNEDLIRNGAIDANEDRNNNGQLDPRKSDVSISLVGSTRTNSNGTAVVRLEYPKNIAGWADVEIKVSASGVVSPPAIRRETLPIEAILKSEVPPPSFQFSPYGLYWIPSLGDANCTDKR